MKPGTLLRFGFFSALLFWGGILALGSMVPQYSHVSHTISAIGAIGSPMRVPFAVLNLGVDVLLLMFAAGVLLVTRHRQASYLSAIFIGLFALADIGTAVFPSPDALHNVFGLSLTIGYMAPLAAAISWRNDASLKSLVRPSLIAWLLLMISMALNLSPIVLPDLYDLRYYGLAQRALFLVWFAWISWLSRRLRALPPPRSAH